MLAFEMAVGCSVFMILPTLLYRRKKLHDLHVEIIDARSSGLIIPFKHLSEANQSIELDYDMLENALGIMCTVILWYFFVVIGLGIVILYYALCLQPNQDELQERGITRFDSAVFLSVSSFANAGLSLTSDSLIGLDSNPCAYILISFLIIMGNTGIPVVLRLILSSILKCQNIYFQFIQERKFSKDYLRQSIYFQKGVQYILDNPRKISTHIFSADQTIVLAKMIVALILLQYVFFLAATMNRSESLSQYSRLELAGIGYFQTMSVRTAGFSMMDLRLLNQGLLVVYAVMMYVSAYPFSSTVEVTKQLRRDDTAQLPVQLNIPTNKNFEGEIYQEVTMETTHNILHNLSPSILWTDGGSSNSNVQPDGLGDGGGFLKEMKRNVFRHTFFLLLAVIVCSFSEDQLITDSSSQVNLWYVMFEIVSAYGTVGLSLGLPGRPYSLSGAFSPVGKLVIILVMLLGKSRGLPSRDDDVIDFEFRFFRRAVGLI